MRKYRAALLLSMCVALIGAAGLMPAQAADSTGGSDPVDNPATAAAEDSIPQSSLLDNTPLEGGDFTPAYGWTDISSWSLAGSGANLTGTVTVRQSLPTGTQLPASPDETGYSFYWHYQSGANANDALSLMHQRQRTGLNTEGERYTFQGPFPIGDNFYWSIEAEYRFTPAQGPGGSNWTFAYTFTYLDPADGLRFIELLPADNPGVSASLSNGGKTVTLNVPYQVRWRNEKAKGFGADVGGSATNCANPANKGATFHCQSMRIAQAGQQIRSAWVSSWTNATSSLPPAVCSVTQPTVGVCSLGGIVSQEDQAPNTVTVLGDYGFVSYVADENCPVFVSTPIAASSNPYYLQVNPLSVNPFWRPCYFKLPQSRTYGVTSHTFTA